MCIPGNVPDNIQSPHLRRPTSLVHFRNIYIIALVPANLNRDLDPYSGHIKLKIIKNNN